MTKDSKALKITLSDPQLVLLARGMVQAMFDMVNGKAAAPIAIPPAAAVDRTQLPAIGAKWNGGIYAGISIADDVPVALTLLPGDEKLNWNDAVSWAEKRGGALPSRIDQLVLFKNVKGEFKEEWYWSGEQHASYSSYAWFQYFSNGGQGYGRKDYDGRARAVRRSVVN